MSRKPVDERFMAVTRRVMTDRGTIFDNRGFERVQSEDGTFHIMAAHVGQTLHDFEEHLSWGSGFVNIYMEDDEGKIYFFTAVPATGTVDELLLPVFRGDSTAHLLQALRGTRLDGGVLYAGPRHRPLRLSPAHPFLPKQA